MKINRVTITGLDTLVELDKVVQLQNDYPFCEWGILFSGNKEGQNRYPTMWTIEQILKTGVPLSAHFCGTWAREVLENGKVGIIKTLHPNFKRVQLNYNFSRNDKWDLMPLNIFADLNKDREIILQYNKSNKPTIEDNLRGFPENVHILHDASGGRGTEISHFQQPFKNYTGYAGGINDENIEIICQGIVANENNDEVWIDMETGVRTNDIFDMDKVEKVLSIAAKYIN